jgi:drug/metabolite transporter (DMT)-like permease
LTDGGSRGADSHPSALRLYSLIGLMVLFWAMNFLIGKVALREFPDMLLAGLRVSLAGALISPVYAFRSRKAPASGEWRRDELPALIFLGFVGVALNQLCFIMGLYRTSVAHASLLMGVTPVMVLLIAAVIGQERITTKKVVGLAIALAGVAVLNHAPSKASGATLLGDFFIFLAATTFALFTVFGKRTTVRHGSVTVNTFAYVGGAMILSPVTIWQASRFAFSGLSAAAWASLLYMDLLLRAHLHSGLAHFRLLVSATSACDDARRAHPERARDIGAGGGRCACAGGRLCRGARLTSALYEDESPDPGQEDRHLAVQMSDDDLLH